LPWSIKADRFVLRWSKRHNENLRLSDRNLKTVVRYAFVIAIIAILILVFVLLNAVS
jgi:hypothetical protein